MITTREIDVNRKEVRKLERKTTKDIDASIDVEHPEGKPVSVSTSSMADVADIAEKKRRDEIMTSRKKGASPKVDGKGLASLNMQFVFVDCDGLVQAVSRRELK